MKLYWHWGSGGSMANALGYWSASWEFKPKHCQAATVGSIIEILFAPEALYHGWPYVPTPSWLTSWDIQWKEHCCNIYVTSFCCHLALICFKKRKQSFYAYTHNAEMLHSSVQHSLIGAHRLRPHVHSYVKQFRYLSSDTVSLHTQHCKKVWNASFAAFT